MMPEQFDALVTAAKRVLEIVHYKPGYPPTFAQYHEDKIRERFEALAAAVEEPAKATA